MNQLEFMNRLDIGIRSMPYDERREILSDYEEHFARGKESGKTEEEMISALGDPDAIAMEYLNGRSSVDNGKSAVENSGTPSYNGNVVMDNGRSSAGKVTEVGAGYSGTKEDEAYHAKIEAESASEKINGESSYGKNGQKTNDWTANGNATGNQATNGQAYDQNSNSWKYNSNQYKTGSSSTPDWAKALLAIAVVLINVLIVAPFWFAIFSVLLAIAITFMAIAIAGVTVIAMAAVHLIMLFVGIALISFGALGLIGIVYLIKYFIIATSSYLKLNGKLIREGRI